MKVGQPTKVTGDLSGGVVVDQGGVAGFSPGTGSSFYLLPPENATGNWIKVVQRVPVKITFVRPMEADSPLILGLSCRAEVEIDHGGKPQGQPSFEPRYLTRSLDEDLRPIDEEIGRIIAENSGSNAAAAYGNPSQ